MICMLTGRRYVHIKRNVGSLGTRLKQHEGDIRTVHVVPICPAMDEWQEGPTCAPRLPPLKATGAPPGPPSPNIAALSTPTRGAAVLPFSTADAAERSTRNLQALRLPAVAASVLRCGSTGVPCHSASAHDFAASLSAVLRNMHSERHEHSPCARLLLTPKRRNDLI